MSQRRSSDESRLRSRRTFLGVAGATAAVVLAGCGDQEDLDDFEDDFDDLENDDFADPDDIPEG